jgi:phage tail-like protein
MADDGTSQSITKWPIPKFYFKVMMNSTEISFQEISGLDTESQQIEYRHGNNQLFSTVKMPGITKYGNVTMKKGVFKSDTKFWDWYNQIKMNTIKKEPVTISLIDETGNTTITWVLTNAWPTKISGTDMKTGGNEVAVETIEISHEGLTIEIQ